MMTTKKGKIKLIIADDHPLFRRGMETAVKSMPCISKVSQASNGEDVIKLLAHEHYDIVLMDIRMAPMDGVKATEIITAKYPKTKVIAISMYDDEKSILAMLDNGAVGYLIKNADRDEVEDAISEVMCGHTFFSKQVSEVLYQKRSQTIKEKLSAPKIVPLNKERLREVVFLICHEFTSEEIADILCLSTRTIETYRSRILGLTKSRSTAGIVKYSLDNGILNDPILKRKFAKALTKQKPKE